MRSPGGRRRASVRRVSLHDVPDAVRAKARVAGAESWLDGLPGLVAEFERAWGITTGRVYGDASEAYVAEAVTDSGEPAVLKLIVPQGGADAADEITTLRLAGGSGCVSLLRSDAGRGALLLDRLGPSLADLGPPFRRRLEILCDTASRVWRPAPDSGLRSGADKGRWLAEFIEGRWEELDRPCSRSAVEHALACARRRTAADSPARAVLVHGDVHQWNALRTRDGTGFALVDPDGLLCEPEYDLGVLLREDPVELLDGDPYARATWLAARTGLDPVAIWEWGVVERVSTGLVCAGIDLQPVAREMLAAADSLARLQVS
jgi:streptomycin 6-kinase